MERKTRDHPSRIWSMERDPFLASNARRLGSVIKKGSNPFSGTGKGWGREKPNVLAFGRGCRGGCQVYQEPTAVFAFGARAHA
jgi:hypothetical protein